MIIADTGALVDHLLGHEPMAVCVCEALANGLLATTAIRALELAACARNERQRRAPDEMFEVFPIWSLVLGATRRAADVGQSLEGDRLGTGIADYLTG